MPRSSWWMVSPLVALAACGDAGSSESYRAHDPCETITIVAATATDVQRAGIAGAVALWQGRGVVAFDPGGGGAVPAPPLSLAIEFDDAAPAFHGAYDPAADRVLINRDLTDAPTLAIVIAHELGHAFGLVHIDRAARISLMNPGNLATPPTDADQRALEAMWGSCR